MSLSLGTNSGSFESLKRRTRCGARPCAFQMRCTEDTLMPAASAMAAAGPVGRLVRRLGGGQGHDPVDDLLPERRHPRGTGLVAQQAIDPFLGEAFLPAPDAGLRLARPAHDLDRAEAAGRKQYDLGPPGMLLRGVAVADDRLQAAAIDGAEGDGDTGAHAARVARPKPIGKSRRGFNCQI